MKLIIAALMLVAPFAAHGQLMKCISSDGRVEYAANCPPGTKEQRTGIRNSPAAAPPSSKAPAPKSLAERDADFKKRQIEQQEARAKDEKKAAESTEKRQACEQAQSYLLTLRSGERISRIDPKTGERSYLEDATRASEIARAQAMVDQTCK